MAEQTKTNGWTNEQTGIDKIEANASTISKKYMDKCVHWGFWQFQRWHGWVWHLFTSGREEGNLDWIWNESQGKSGSEEVKIFLAIPVSLNGLMNGKYKDSLNTPLNWRILDMNIHLSSRRNYSWNLELDQNKNRDGRGKLIIIVIFAFNWLWNFLL